MSSRYSSLLRHAPMMPREDMSADDALDLVARCARKAAQDMRDDLRVNVYR